MTEAEPVRMEKSRDRAIERRSSGAIVRAADWARTPWWLKGGVHPAHAELKPPFGGSSRRTEREDDDLVAGGSVTRSALGVMAEPWS
ncbi:MAG TPA: hypothetical protein DEB06_06615 [Phycisphaerales bacterium]|nr:hypothetical protein [Phycisphaerales bacterium]